VSPSLVIDEERIETQKRGITVNLQNESSGLHAERKGGDEKVIVVI